MRCDARSQHSCVRPEKPSIKEVIVSVCCCQSDSVSWASQCTSSHWLQQQRKNDSNARTFSWCCNPLIQFFKLWEPLIKLFCCYFTTVILPLWWTCVATEMQGIWHVTPRLRAAVLYKPSNVLSLFQCWHYTLATHTWEHLYKCVYWKIKNHKKLTVKLTSSKCCESRLVCEE